jgi:predicted transcriptional regulator
LQTKFLPKIQKNNRTRYIALCDYLKSEYSIKVIDVIPEESKPFSKIYNKNKKELLLSDYSSLETKKLHAAAQIAQEGASKEIDKYLSTFSFPSEESKKLTKVALLNYCGAAILMPYKLFHSECKKLKYDLGIVTKYICNIL